MSSAPVAKRLCGSYSEPDGDRSLAPVYKPSSVSPCTDEISNTTCTTGWRGTLRGCAGSDLGAQQVTCVKAYA